MVWAPKEDVDAGWSDGERKMVAPREIGGGVGKRFPEILTILFKMRGS